MGRIITEEAICRRPEERTSLINVPFSKITLCIFISDRFGDHRRGFHFYCAPNGGSAKSFCAKINCFYLHA